MAVVRSFLAITTLAVTVTVYNPALAGEHCRVVL